MGNHNKASHAILVRGFLYVKGLLQMLLIEYIAKHTGMTVRTGQPASAPAGAYVFLQRIGDSIRGMGIADYEHYDHAVTFRITAFREGAWEAMLNLRTAIMRDNVEVKEFNAQEPIISDVMDASEYNPATAYEDRARMDLSLKYRSRLMDSAPNIAAVRIAINLDDTQTEIEVTE